MDRRISIEFTYDELMVVLPQLPHDQHDKILEFVDQEEARLFAGIHPKLWGIARVFYLQKRGYIKLRRARTPVHFCTVCTGRHFSTWGLTPTSSLRVGTQQSLYSVCEECKPILHDFIEAMKRHKVKIKVS
jgi:hypothetical protein